MQLEFIDYYTEFMGRLKDNDEDSRDKSAKRKKESDSMIEPLGLVEGKRSKSMCSFEICINDPWKF